MKSLFALLLSSGAAFAHPLITPGTSFSLLRIDDRHVTATGTWRSVDGSRDVDDALNTVDLGCRRQIRQCVLAEAYVTDTSRLFVRRYEFKIARWDAKEIRADLDEPCRRVTLVLNLSRKVAYKSSRAVRAAGCAPGEFNGPDTPRLQTLEEPSAAPAATSTPSSR